MVYLKAFCLHGSLLLFCVWECRRSQNFGQNLPRNEHPICYDGFEWSLKPAIIAEFSDERKRGLKELLAWLASFSFIIVWFGVIGSLPVLSKAS